MKVDLARGDLGSHDMKPTDRRKRQCGGCPSPEEAEDSAAPPPERGGGTLASYSPAKASTEVHGVPA